VVVDMHAGATSEKQAMGRYLDGRVAAVLGTHTHVPTADARLLPGGTAYVTDLGMVGPTESVIGTEIDAVLRRFLTGLPTRLPVAEKSPTVQFNAVLVEIDETSRKARAIQRVDREWRRDGE
ncbi:MAG: YmdB family metallophosphoesterase, partial [Dehalococcoidia bacterium]|nr:YmdB family metallophosphoesterase [Dehalococcoidia bacterium]